MLKQLPFYEKIKTVQQSDLGLTNQNYVVTLIDETKLFVRIPYEHNHDLFDYHLESQIHHLIQKSEINLPFLFFDETKGIKVSPFIQNIKHLDELDLIKALPKVAKQLKKLHSFPKVNVDFNVVDKYELFKSKTNNQIIDLIEFEPVLNQLNTCPERVLCHNDLVNGNVIEVNQKVYLIDYEYACNNHPYFDLLSLITENNIQNKRVRTLFYEAYFDGPLTQDIQKDLDVFESIHNLLWCQWAQMQYSILKEEIYKEIAFQKFDQLKKTYHL